MSRDISQKLDDCSWIAHEDACQAVNDAVVVVFADARFLGEFLSDKAA
ncbi:MAG: hypothetical protein ABSA46_09440 [Thermodesulfovibrionales bacterium]|jgi:hypothetical protein